MAESAGKAAPDAPSHMAHGDPVETCPGVFIARIPLPKPPGSVNVALLHDVEGWTVFDTGVRSAAAEARWETLLEGLVGRRGHLARIVVSHMHSDHIGMAGWLAQRSGAVLAMSAAEYLTGRMLEAVNAGPAPEAAVAYQRRAGWPEDDIAAYRAAFGGYRKAIHQLPGAYVRLREGDSLSIGGRQWQVRTIAGHSPEQVCLQDTGGNILLAGDTVLSRISPNVSVPTWEPEANPLQDWLTGLERLTRWPRTQMVIPGHGAPIADAATRARALVAEHEAALARVLEALDQPRRAIDLFETLFHKPVTRATRFLASGESLAHLHSLRARGQVAPRTDERGVVWWQRV